MTTQSDIVNAAEIRQTFSQPEFGSLAEAMDFAGGKPSDGWGDKDNLSSKEESESREKFTGTKSWPAAKELAAKGWDEGRAKVAAALHAVFESGTCQLATAPAVEYSVGGAFPDVQRYVAGDIEHMVNDGCDDNGQRPIVRFLVNLCASAAVKADAIANRGAAVAALVDQIESGGTRCEIWVTSASGKGKKLHAPMICAKAAGDVLDIDTVAFAMGHPSMLRRVFFAMTENDPFTDGEGYEGGYGSVMDIPAKAMPADVIYLAALHREVAYSTPEKAMDEVRRLYNEQAEQKGLEAQR